MQKDWGHICIYRYSKCWWGRSCVVYQVWWTCFWTCQSTDHLSLSVDQCRGGDITRTSSESPSTVWQQREETGRFPELSFQCGGGGWLMTSAAINPSLAACGGFPAVETLTLCLPCLSSGRGKVTRWYESCGIPRRGLQGLFVSFIDFTFTDKIPVRTSAVQFL